MSNAPARQIEPAARTRQAIEPRGLNRVESAAYVGVGTSMFDALIREGKMPAPARLNGRLIWDRRALDRAMDELFDVPAAYPATDDKWSRVAP